MSELSAEEIVIKRKEELCKIQAQAASGGGYAAVQEVIDRDTAIISYVETLQAQVRGLTEALEEVKEALFQVEPVIDGEYEDVLEYQKKSLGEDHSCGPEASCDGSCSDVYHTGLVRTLVHNASYKLDKALSTLPAEYLERERKREAVIRRQRHGLIMTTNQTFLILANCWLTP